MVLDLKKFPKRGMGWGCTICKTPEPSWEKTAMFVWLTRKNGTKTFGHFGVNGKKVKP